VLSGKVIARVVAPVVAVAAIALFVIARQSGVQPDAAGSRVEQTAQAPVDQLTAQPQVTESAPEPERIVLAQNDAAAMSGRFTLGTHYTRLSPTQPTSSSPDQIEVAEIFWYGCPHCYTFDPYLESWKQDLPANVSFVRIPAMWNPLLQIHARAFYTAEALGKGEEMHVPLFREIHVNGNGLNSAAAIQEFFERFGVSAEEFEAASASFAVSTKLRRAEELMTRYRIASVPTVIVNGKYSTDASAAGSYDVLVELIDELVASEAAGN